MQLPALSECIASRLGASETAKFWRRKVQVPRRKHRRAPQSPALQGEQRMRLYMRVQRAWSQICSGECVRGTADGRCLHSLSGFAC